MKMIKTSSQVNISRKIICYVLLQFFLVFTFLIHPNILLAQDNSISEHFYTSLTSTYTVDTSGNTRVEHAFRIRNETPEYFINRYNMKLGTNAISNISVTAGQQLITPQVVQDVSGTQIDIEFPDKLVGKDKIREFRISYSNPVMSEVNGWVMETFIPAMSSEDTYNEHKVILVTPLQFGHPSRIKPENYTIKQDGQNFVLTYSNLTDEGVSAIFGSQQIFRLGIRYHLDNPNNQPAITQVSLPPDTPYQKLIYHLLEPRPQEIESDLDGNWIATYYLPANDTVEVNIDASVLVSLEQLNPRLNINPIKEHIASQPYWEKNNTEIIQLAQKYLDPFDAYQFVVEKLEYTKEDITDKLDRLGAVEALKRPTFATCQEFTDLFIALVRANNIPARRATGYAHSNDPILQPLSLVTDILHAWPEYYNQEQKHWIPVDPTWGSTMKGVDYFHQFDLKHIVFAYNGRSSRLPLAAGNYKIPDQESKDIQIEFEQEFPKSTPEFTLSLKPRKLLGIIKIPSWYELEIENLVGQAWYEGSMAIEGESQQLQITPNKQILTFLPWQKLSFPVQVYNENSWLPQTDQISITFIQDEIKFLESFEIKTTKPMAPNISQLISQNSTNEQQYIHPNLNITTQQLQVILGIFIVITAITAGSLLVFGRRRSNIVRRQGKKS